MEFLQQHCVTPDSVGKIKQKAVRFARIAEHLKSYLNLDSNGFRCREQMKNRARIRRAESKENLDKDNQISCLQR